MIYRKMSPHGVEETGRRLEAAVQAQGFGLIHTLDLQAKLISKGVPFARACRIYEVCNPHQAKVVLERDMAIATALPCRIVVSEEPDGVAVSTMRPTQTLAMFGHPELAPVAADVEGRLVAMIDAAVAR